MGFEQFHRPTPFRKIVRRPSGYTIVKQDIERLMECLCDTMIDVSLCQAKIARGYLALGQKLCIRLIFATTERRS